MILAQNMGNLLDFKQKLTKVAYNCLIQRSKLQNFSREKIPPDPTNVNSLVQEDGVHDFTPEKVGNTEICTIIAWICTITA